MTKVEPNFLVKTFTRTVRVSAPLILVVVVLGLSGCGKKLAPEQAEALIRDAQGGQHDVMCSYKFDKVATLPGYSLNSDKDKCGEKLRLAGLAELGHFLEESDAREHQWESVIQAKAPARMNDVTLSFPCGVAKFSGIVGVSQENGSAKIRYREVVEPRPVPDAVYARCEITPPTPGPKEQTAVASLREDGTWGLLPPSPQP